MAGASPHHDLSPAAPGLGTKACLRTTSLAQVVHMCVRECVYRAMWLLFPFGSALLLVCLLSEALPGCHTQQARHGLPTPTLSTGPAHGTHIGLEYCGLKIIEPCGSFSAFASVWPNVMWSVLALTSHNPSTLSLQRSPCDFPLPSPLLPQLTGSCSCEVSPRSYTLSSAVFM